GAARRHKSRYSRRSPFSGLRLPAVMGLASLMRHLVTGPEVPDTPELEHIRGRAHRDADMLIEHRDWRRQRDVIFPEVLDDLDGRASRSEHHEIRMRVDRPHHPCVRLIEKLLPLVSVPSFARQHMFGVVERRDGRACSDDVHFIWKLIRSKPSGSLWSGDGVSDSQSCQAENLWKAARDDHAVVVQRTIDK